jgi:acyl carrier protein
MNHQEMQEKVLDAITEALRLESRIGLNDPFEAIDMDSLDIAQMAAELEDAVDTEIEYTALADMKTPGDVVVFLMETMGISPMSDSQPA